MDFLNDNAGAIQGIATAVLVVITGAYVWVTWQTLRTIQRSQRPYVFVDVTSGGGPHLDIAVGNHGDRAASNVRFEVVRGIDVLGEPKRTEDDMPRPIAHPARFGTGSITCLPAAATGGSSWPRIWTTKAGRVRAS